MVEPSVHGSIDSSINGGAKTGGQFEGFLVGKDVILPLLQFADDTLLFCKYDVKMLLKVKDAIRLF